MSQAHRIHGPPDHLTAMTWSYAGPDGRATWEWVRVTDSETGELHPAIRLRRIGGHAIFADP